MEKKSNNYGSLRWRKIRWGEIRYLHYTRQLRDIEQLIVWRPNESLKNRREKGEWEECTAIKIIWIIVRYPPSIAATFIVPRREREAEMDISSDELRLYLHITVISAWKFMEAEQITHNNIMDISYILVLLIFHQKLGHFWLTFGLL